MDEETALVCMPIDLMPVPAVPEATQDKCSKCSKPVWVSPASREVARQHKAVMVCLRCVDPTAEATVAPLSDGQKKEFLDNI
jgi:hypothetical protein